MTKTLAMAMLIVGSTWRVPGSDAASPSTRPATQPSTQPARELILDLGNKVTMELVLIPAGKFLMGSPQTEVNRNKDEVQHEVTISEPFYMGVTPVTVDQFAAFVKDSGYKTDAEMGGISFGFEIKDGGIEHTHMDGCSWRNPSYSQKGDHPVVQISWYDARDFCSWLSDKAGRTVVLPTEAQWEYACRAGTKTAYPWGDNPDDGEGWANGIDLSYMKRFPFPPRMIFSWDDGFVFTSPVGSFRPNAFGLFDMNGNAWQWCQDRYGDYGEAAVTDPTGPDTGDDRVLRGGWWRSDPEYCRSASRHSCPRDEPPRGGAWHCWFGFRVVVVAEGVAPDAGVVAPATQPAKELTLELGNKVLSLDLGNEVTMKLVRIPAGQFLIGSPESEKDRGRDETQHEVTISRPFYMGVYEVTQAQWQAVMGMNPSRFKGDNRPVERVSWDDCQSFCQALSATAGRTIRLPTEAEWEYACRAGTKTQYCFGDGAFGDAVSQLAWYAWYDGNSMDQTHDVGRRIRNAWGLYDMHGNVWEWCQDSYGAYSAGSQTDPTGPLSGSFRVVRGGSWSYGAYYCRAAYRGVSDPVYRLTNLGFRLAMDSE